MKVRDIEEKAIEERAAWRAIRDLVSECNEYKKGRHIIEYLERAAERHKRKMEKYEKALDAILTKILEES